MWRCDDSNGQSFDTLSHWFGAGMPETKGAKAFGLVPTTCQAALARAGTARDAAEHSVNAGPDFGRLNVDSSFCTV